MKFNLAVDYCLTNRDDEAFQKEPRLLTDYLVAQALSAKYAGQGQGIRDGTVRRAVARIERKLRHALRDKVDEVDFELGELETLQDALNAWGGVTHVSYMGVASSSVAHVVFQQELLDAIETAIKDAKDAAASARNGTPAPGNPEKARI